MPSDLVEAMSSNRPIPHTELFAQTEVGLAAANDFLAAARVSVRGLVAPRGTVDAEALQLHQFAAHGFAWVATYVAALEQLRSWALELQSQGKLGDLEAAFALAGFGEYLAQMRGGIVLSQVEMIRPTDLNIPASSLARFDGAVQPLVAMGTDPRIKLRIAEQIRHGHFGEPALDETLSLVREQFRKFCAAEVEPHAHRWHLDNAYIPLDVVDGMAKLGAFGLTIEEEFGGHGLGKLAMAVTSEELSRAYIGVGSLGTRSEIAADLIRMSGTAEQKRHWLPRIASGEILPTAVFTEPNSGSDLGSVQTRAVRDGDVYRITGNKTWITHASRADMMTLLARTDPGERNHRGLSMFLAPKPRGDERTPFPAAGMSGTEIEVLGYRGMKEYEIRFDGFQVPASSLLGGVEGNGFKQVMATLETGRIQTGARAVGVAQCALELGLAYALTRVQFGKPLIAFPRIAIKLAWMAVETMIARRLTYFAAREKDRNQRCDIQAGMAKLLAARVAWANADAALQIHGGNGFALEFPISRVLCDARVLNIFEGAAEIQALVIARGLLD